MLGYRQEEATVDVHAKVAEIRQLVTTARSMPMSSSCVLSRSELVDQLDELARMLTHALGDADRVIADRTAVLDRGQAEAERIVADARIEHEKLVGDTEVYRIARRAAEQMVDEAREESAALRRETDDYVDERLAGLELSLQKTLEAVSRGRSRLQARSELDDLHSGGSTPLPDPFGD